MKWTEQEHRVIGISYEHGYFVTIARQSIDQRYLVTIEKYNGERCKYMVYEGFVEDTLESAKEETLRRLGLQ